jgi:hypothetical protein
MAKKTKYFFSGYDVTLSDGRVGIVDHQLPNYDVLVRVYDGVWPFAEMRIEKPKDLERVSVFDSMEEALL